MNSRFSTVQIGLLLEAGLLVAALLLGLLFGVSPLDLWRPELTSLLWGGLATAALVLLLFVLRYVPLPSVQRLFGLMREFYIGYFRDASVLDLALVSLAAGVGEEFLFRGFLQQGLGQLVGPVGGLVGASLLFGLAHLVTVTYAVLAALSGLFLGWLLMFTGDLTVPVLAHALYDFIALLYLRRSVATAA